jgi:hypothetical protein
MSLQCIRQSAEPWYKKERYLRKAEFISEALADSKKYYSEMEKVCYAAIMSVSKLRHHLFTSKPTESES